MMHNWYQQRSNLATAFATLPHGIFQEGKSQGQSSPLPFQLFSERRISCQKAMKKNGRCCKPCLYYMHTGHRGMASLSVKVLLRYLNGPSKDTSKHMRSIFRFTGRYPVWKRPFVPGSQISLQLSALRNIHAGSGCLICLTSKTFKDTNFFLPSDLRSYSVITGTPPSIREDATIHMAPEIFKGIDIPSPILQILAEAELCLLWGKVSTIYLVAL